MARRLWSNRSEADVAITRRQFGAVVCGGFGFVSLGDGCRALGELSQSRGGRLSGLPKTVDKTIAAPGTARLGLAPSGRDATLRVPPNPDGPLPLLVLLHGAGGTGQRMLQRIAPAVEATNLVVLAIDSREATWDAIRTDFGPDVGFLGRALQRVFETVAIDPARLVLGGFSDGATYALSLGLINGDVFQSVIAFSPGFVVTGDDPHGKPHFFISHGTADPILPIDGASRVIVPALRNHGYDVTYREFQGAHEVPPPIAAEAMTWAAARRA